MSNNEVNIIQRDKNTIDELYPELGVTEDDISLAHSIFYGYDSPLYTALEYNMWELAVQDAARMIANYRKNVK